MKQLRERVSMLLNPRRQIPNEGEVKLQEELKRCKDEAEFHAHSVRQLIAERARLFEVTRIVGLVAGFKGGPSNAGSDNAGSDNAGSSLGQVLELVQTAPSQFLQETFCLLLNGGKRNGFFVEFGACDGLLINNTLLLERNFGWRGILSEPAKAWQDQIKSNRNCVIETRCVWSESGQQIDFAEFSDDNYKTQSGILETAGSELPTAKTYPVETVSLVDMLRQNDAPRHIDFISVDTEGSEFRILEGFLFDQYSFGFLAIEHHQPSVEQSIKTLLEGVGYKQVLRKISGHDGFYVPIETAAALNL